MAAQDRTPAGGLRIRITTRDPSDRSGRTLVHSESSLSEHLSQLPTNPTSPQELRLSSHPTSPTSPRRVLPRRDSSSQSLAEVAKTKAAPRRNALLDALKRLVSRKKKRFQRDGFDLDLTYVTPRLVAMGYPSENLEAAYRNAASEIEALIEAYHGLDNVKLYNLCAERSYPAEAFSGHFQRFPFHDHAPPPLGMFYFFCTDVARFLAAAPEHVALVHCKAGKGRTGVMLAAYLVWAGEAATAAEALEFYATARTDDAAGVTIPSQRRFVGYFEELLARGPAARANRFRAAVPEDPRDGAASSTWNSNHSPATGGTMSPLRSVWTAVSVRSCRTLPREPTDAGPPRVEFDDDSEPREASSPALTLARVLAHADVVGRSGSFRRLPTEEDAKAGSDESLSRGRGFRGTAPRAAIRRLAPALDGAWNAQNRLQARGACGVLPAPVVLALREITLRDAPRSVAARPSFVIRCGDFEYASAGLLRALGAPERHAPGLVRLPLPDALVADEVHVTFYKRTRLGKRKRAFSFWFHTAFAGLRLSLAKAELDKAHKDTRHRKFPAGFGVDLVFAEHGPLPGAGARPFSV